MEKPTIGLFPRYLWDEQRLNDVANAIGRKIQVFQTIPQDWIIEYNQLCESINVSKVNRQAFIAPTNQSELVMIILHDTSPLGMAEKKDRYDVVSCKSGKILFTGTGEDCKREYPNYVRT